MISFRIDWFGLLAVQGIFNPMFSSVSQSFSSLWNSNTLATLCKELTHWKRPWCWEGFGAGGEGDDIGWDGWMISLTQWTWVWVNYGSWWWTGWPGVLESMWLRRVGQDWATELNWTDVICSLFTRGLLGGASGKESACQCRRHKRWELPVPGLEKIPWSRKWQPIPVFLPGKFHGQRSPAVSSCKESCRTEDWAQEKEHHHGWIVLWNSFIEFLPMGVCVCESLRHVQLFAIPWSLAFQACPSVGFSRQEYRGRLPFPSPGDRPDPGIEPGSPALQADSSLSEPPWKHVGGIRLNSVYRIFNTMAPNHMRQATTKP